MPMIVGVDLAHLNGAPDPFERNEEIAIFFEHNRANVRSCDALVAFLPHASMGTAIEVRSSPKVIL